MSIFGQITAAFALEDAIRDTLNQWFPVYLREYERQADLVSDNIEPLKHPLPKRYMTSNSMDEDAGSALPTIVIVSPGLSQTNRPKQEGDGSFRVWWTVQVGVFVSAENRQSTMKLVREYAAIVRSILLQKQSLGGFADGATWLDESYDDNFSFTDEQSISAGDVKFEFEVAGVVNRFDGPVGPPDPVEQPGSDWPLAETVIATVVMKED